MRYPVGGKFSGSLQAQPDSIGESRSLILETIGDPPDLTLFRGPGNIGDHLIWAGAAALLVDHIYREIELEELCGSSGHTLLVTGGAAMCRPFHEWMPRALRIAELRFERVIVLPTSFDVSEDIVRETLSRTRATVFARERESHRQILQLCDSRLAHDCAYYFDYKPYRGAGSGTLQAFRTDREASGRPVPEGNRDISATEPDLDSWLRTIAAHELVRTDRAHVMIAAALLGKQVEYASSSYHKVDSLARFGLEGYPVRMIEPGPGSEPGPPATVLPARARHFAAPRATAVVLTRDRPASALRALDSLGANRVSLGVLVLDNNSAPAASRELTAGCAGREEVRIVRSDRNLGCGGGRRFATGMIDSELVLFLDDDAELEPGALDLLVAELDEHLDAGAVTATVLFPDGSVHHSGGWFSTTDGLAQFDLLGSGAAPDSLPPSGPVDWVPGTACLVRRELLSAFPIDPRMSAYYEDNEWCYRVSADRGRRFLRSREARAVHHSAPKALPGLDFTSRSAAIEMLSASARFYQRHRVVLATDLTSLVPELHTGPDGLPDLVAARLLLELLLANGGDRTLMQWMNGELDGLLRSGSLQDEGLRLRSELDALLAERDAQLAERDVRLAERDAQLAEREARIAERDHGLGELTAAVLDRDRRLADQAELVGHLSERHQALAVLEGTGWFRLGARLEPAFAIYNWIRSKGRRAS